MKRLFLVALVLALAGYAWATFPGSPIGGGSSSGTATAITDNLIVDADVNSAANIDATKLGTGAVTNTEFNYLDNVTSSIQTQLNAKAPIASPTFTGTVTAPEFLSSAADNTRGVTVPNTADPTTTNLAAGKGWFNTTSNMLKWRNGDNTATREIFTSGAAHTLNFATTGTLTGGIMILDNVTGPTAAQCYGSLDLMTSAGTVLLPTAVAGMSICVVDGAGTASDLIVDVQATDNVILVGVTQAGGVGITNASGSSTGDYVCLVSSAANKWRVLGKQGTWASQ